MRGPRALKAWKTRVLRTRVRGSVWLLALVGAAGLLVVRPTPSCACTTKAGAYRTMMRSALRDLVVTQDRHRDSTGRFATSVAFREEAAGMVVLGFAADSTGYSAIVSHGYFRALRGTYWTRCSVAVGAAPVHFVVAGQPEREPVCDPYPIDGAHLGSAVAYLFLLAAAGILLLWRSWGRMRGVPWVPLGALGALVLVHPFSEPVQRPHPCESLSAVPDTFALMLAGLLLYAAIRRGRTRVPSTE